MKTTNAWAWLTAGVLALGLNGFYQDGGAAWAHRGLNRVMAGVSQRTEGVLALASGRIDWFLAKSRPAVLENESVVLALEEATPQIGSKGARVQVARVQALVAAADEMSAREQVRAARIEAQEARLVASRARMEARAEARDARVHEEEAAFDRVVCPRIRGRIPRVRVSVPLVHFEMTSLPTE